MASMADKQFLELIKHVKENGKVKGDRTGTGTISIFGYQMRFNLEEGFPLLTTKKVHLRNIWEELEWFLEGNTNASTLAKKKVGIWTPDAYRWYKKHGGTLTEEEFKEWLLENDFDLGPIYGKQWRSWETVDGQVVDQIANVIEEIKNNPDSRRLIVNAWNVGEINKMALPPCHVLFQFYVQEGKLSCQLYQRSCDIFLGGSYNIASYALLVHLIAQQTNLEVGEFIHTFGDAHIYLNHLEQVEEQLKREPRPLPKLKLNKKDSIFDYRWEDIILEGYDPHPFIKAEVSVGK